MIKKIVFFSSILVLIAMSNCKNNEADTVAPIAFDHMKNILTDMHIAEYKSQGIGDKEGTFLKNDDSLAYYYASILHKYEIDTASFSNALQWYMQHPQIFDSMYKQITHHISESVDSFKAITPAPTEDEKQKVDNMLKNLKSTDKPEPSTEEDID